MIRNKNGPDNFVSLNRSKKSVDIDLKSQEGKEAFLSLVTSADVVVEKLSPRG